MLTQRKKISEWQRGTFFFICFENGPNSSESFAYRQIIGLCFENKSGDTCSKLYSALVAPESSQPCRRQQTKNLRTEQLDDTTTLNNRKRLNREKRSAPAGVMSTAWAIISTRHLKDGWGRNTLFLASNIIDPLSLCTVWRRWETMS